MATKKLIEVALPLEKINAESAREKSIRHGHPSTLHLWWARRPLATARAVIWSSLVDDPSSHPELFPSEEAQNRERNRLFRILEELVVWENSNNDNILEVARNEIRKSVKEGSLSLLDPFSGGGAIPLEAQRLGLEPHAHDLNPVSILINKAMIEIPSLFSEKPPINPDDHISRIEKSWKGVQGLAADVNYYGKWLKKEVFNEIGYLYPEVRLPKVYGDNKATVMAWIWARTVKCPNPACKCNAPLVKSFTVCNKPKKKYSINVQKKDKKNEYSIKEGMAKIEETVNRKGATCIHCGSPISFSYIREESKAGHIIPELMAVVAEGKNGRVYLSPDNEQIQAANIEFVQDVKLGELAFYPGYINPVAYGLTQVQDLFTNRQLVMLTTFNKLLIRLEEKIIQDANEIGLQNDHIGLDEGGSGVKAYAEAITIYLSFVFDKLADYNSAICSWHNTGEKIGHTFGMTGMAMRWDFCEANPFSNSSGCFDNMLRMVVKSVENLPTYSFGHPEAKQFDAQEDSGLRNVMVSTDPPYYSNVPYADFSDFFYGWMRKNVSHIYPTLFATMQTPKETELVADPYRAGSKELASEFFEKGMEIACKQIYQAANDDFPITIYYAFKESDSSLKNNAVSTGWEKMLNAIISAKLTITGTWPMRTEMSSRTRNIGANALASSIVLVCRKRSEDAPQITRRNLVSALKRELRPALKRLQESNIAPVDLAQSAIGPGMGVFSRYLRVLEADGTPMSTRSALQLINEEIDLYFNEQVGDLDAASRFCVDLYTQNAYNDIKYGEAEVLSNAKGSSIGDYKYVKSISTGRFIPDSRQSLTDAIGVNRSTNRSGFISLEVKKLDQFQFSKQVRGEPGDIVLFRVHMINTTENKLEGWAVRIICPANMEYINGRTSVANATNPTGIRVSDNLNSDVGMNIGDYGVGGNAYVYFYVRIGEEAKEADENNIYRMIAQCSAGHETGTVEDYADVIVASE